MTFFSAEDKELVSRVLREQDKFYYRYPRIKIKPNGVKKKRWITRPSDEYIELQRKFLIFFETLKIFPIHETAYGGRTKGFGRKASPETCAENHLGKRYILVSDIIGFFDNITEAQLERLFQDVLLKEDEQIIYDATLKFLDVSVKDIVYLLTVPDREDPSIRRVPQGFSTSPYLANAVRYPIDIELHAEALSRNWTYTTWIDDIQISGSDVNYDFLPTLKSIVNKHGFKIDFKKTKIKPYFTRQTILGLKVNKNIRVPKKYLQNTLIDLAERGEIDGRLQGKLSYVTVHDMQPSDKRYLDKIIGKK